MGVVYEAHDRERQEPVALKTMVHFDGPSIYLLKNEFRALSAVRSCNLVRLHELFFDSSHWYFTMELVRGKPFDTWVRPKGELDPERLRRAFQQLLAGLDKLHTCGKLHRDIKPSNVLVTNEGRVVVLDFGLVADVDQGGPGQTVSEGIVLGTPEYMAPEQAAGRRATAASDFYAVGVMLYEALTERLPFIGTLGEIIAAKQRDPPPDVRSGSTSCRDLEEICHRLLSIDPNARPTAQQLRLLWLKGDRAERSSPVANVPVEETCVGRREQLEFLSSALAASTAGRTVVVLVTGESGIGKTALCSAFLNRLKADDGAAIITGRCYEHESLPYKGLDPLVDDLSRYLRRLPREQALAYLPREVHAIATVFPALARIPAIADAPVRAARNLPEHRRRAFTAFVELLGRIADHRPLAIWIDDLQWTDADSAKLLRYFFLRRAPTPGLFLLSYRSTPGTFPNLSSRVVQAAASNHAVDMRRLELSGLAAEHAEQVARALLPSGKSGFARAIAQEAHGNPFFVGELARFAGTRSDVNPGVSLSLDEVLAARRAALPETARTLLEILALAGQPLPIEVVIRAARAEIADLDLLRAANFARGGEYAGSKWADCYHDRIRESTQQSLSSTDLRSLYHRLAQALQSTSNPDHVLVSRYHELAGDALAAANSAATAAKLAVGAMAFERAATHYRRALQRCEPDHGHRLEWTRALAGALELAGRGAEAARAYQDAAVLAGEGAQQPLLPSTAGDHDPVLASRALAAPTVNVVQALTLRMLATAQLLRAGKLTQGFAELSAHAELFGVRFPRNEAVALAMLLTRSGRIRIQERRLRIRTTTGARDPETSLRLDALWEVAAAVATADLLRGAVYSAELALRAFRSGDPAHIAGACGLRAVEAAARNDSDRAKRLLDIADEASHTSGAPHIIARAQGLRGICYQLQGKFSPALKQLRTSQESYRACGRSHWELAMVTWWEMASACFSGRVSDLKLRIPEILRDAEARGDIYAATSFRTYRCIWAWLGMDRPDIADLQVDIAEREWDPNGYQFQNWHMTYARSEIALYRGVTEHALERVNREWKRARIVRQVQAVRADMHYMRARLTLAGHRSQALGPRLHRLAIADARALLREKTAWTDALGMLILGCAASFESQQDAVRLLLQAEQQAHVAEMPVHAAVSRVRRGELHAGPVGRRLADTGLEQLQQLGIERPHAFVELLAPIRPNRAIAR